jgi:hypothetical protein
VIWADLLSQAGANARPLARYLVFMTTAGVIAAFGVIYANTTLGRRDGDQPRSAADLCGGDGSGPAPLDARRAGVCDASHWARLCVSRRRTDAIALERVERPQLPRQTRQPILPSS